MSEIVTRFAPSPTGLLHLGHAYSALFAAQAGTCFLLRIEDIDPARCRPEYQAAILQDLTWLGLSWPKPVRVQSQHMADYQAALQQLQKLGVVYPCFCSRKDIAAELAAMGYAPHANESPIYPGTCRHLSSAARASKSAQQPEFCWRLDVAQALKISGKLTWHDKAQGTQDAQPEILGDIVLARKDVPTSYHLSVVVDDALQGINLVTRGQDLFSATHTHRLLQALLHLPVPQYHHHGLLLNKAGVRFSKRDGAQSLQQLRAQGLTPEKIIEICHSGFVNQPLS